jgi:hypothetical protein
MSKKNLLQESTIRRFWKLAAIMPLTESPEYIQEEEEEDLEEAHHKGDDDKDKVDEMAKMKKDEDLDEMAKMKKDEDLDEMAKMKKDEDLEEGVYDELRELEDLETADEPEGEAGLDAMDAGPEEDVDAEVSVPESDVESLRAARDVIDQILSAADGNETPEIGDDEEMDLSDDEEIAPMEEEFAGVDEDALNEMIEAITSRVSKRIVKEALIRKLTK